MRTLLAILFALLAVTAPARAWDGAGWDSGRTIQRIYEYETDATSSAAAGLSPWQIAAVSAGTIANGTATINHPGVVLLGSSATPDSGYVVYTSGSNFLFGGSEESITIFQIITTALTTARIGFHDSSSAVQPTDGCWLEIVGTTASGYCKNNAGPTQTGSTYTITQGSWYRSLITLNPTASLATFSIFAESGALLWTSTVAANIPTTAGREFANKIVVTNSGSSAIDLMGLDYLSMTIFRTLVR